jgi:hypothetical protein
MNVGFWLENQKYKGHLEDEDVGGGIIFKRVLEKEEGML